MIYRCEWCKKPLKLDTEPWTTRVLPTTQREGVVCESCTEGLEEEARVGRAADEALERDVAAAVSVDRAVRAGERARRRTS